MNGKRYQGPNTVLPDQPQRQESSASWWTEPRTRDEFRDAVASQLPRMLADRSTAAKVRPITIG